VVPTAPRLGRDSHLSDTPQRGGFAGGSRLTLLRRRQGEADKPGERTELLAVLRRAAGLLAQLERLPAAPPAGGRERAALRLEPRRRACAAPRSSSDRLASKLPPSSAPLTAARAGVGGHTANNLCHTAAKQDAI